MIHPHIRRVVAVLLILTTLLSALSLVGCANRGATLAELDGHKITVNEYKFLLSRVKASLSYSGYSVEKDSFWEMVIDKDGTTYDTYFRQAALTDARRYLAALALFDEEGLSLPKGTEENIDKEIEEYIRDAGSKSALNSQLAVYGINIDMLRDIYLMEAKFDAVKEHFYGADGSKVAAQVRLQYLNDYAVCFRQVLIRAFDYVYETDKNGDTVYFVAGGNTGKVGKIAYDKIKGNVRIDEYGKTVTDKNGDDVYYLDSGKIAYDTENGVRAIVYDEKGIAETVKYSAEKLAEHKAAAEEILATVEPGDYAAFESLLAEYAIDDDDAFVSDGEYCFLYTTGDNSYDYLNDIADTLKDAKPGELRMINSEYGYNVVMKYAIPEDAVTNTAYEGWFEDLSDRVIAELFHIKCSPYMDKVVVSDEEFAALPSMKEIGTNKYY